MMEQQFMTMIETSFLHKFSTWIFAQNFYAALCNCEWEDSNHNKISFSWREAGGFVAEIRNNHFGVTEDYLDYYCSGIAPAYEDVLNSDLSEEGIVTEEVSECMCTIGMEMISGPSLYDDGYFKNISLC